MPKSVVVLFLIFSFVAAGTVVAVTAQAQNLVTNGEFNIGGPPANLTDWTQVGNWLSYDYPDTTANAGVGGVAPPGYVVSLSNAQSDGPAGVSQALVTAVGQQYNISLFWGVSAGSGNAPDYQFVEVFWNNALVSTLYSPNASNWASFTSSSVIGTGSDTLTIEGLDNAGYTYVADVSVVSAVSPVPEPAALLFLGPGLIGLAAIRRRLKK